MPMAFVQWIVSFIVVSRALLVRIIIAATCILHCMGTTFHMT